MHILYNDTCPTCLSDWWGCGLITFIIHIWMCNIMEHQSIKWAYVREWSAYTYTCIKHSSRPYCQRKAGGICCILSSASGWSEEESLHPSLRRWAESFPRTCVWEKQRNMNEETERWRPQHIHALIISGQNADEQFGSAWNRKPTLIRVSEIPEQL